MSNEHLHSVVLLVQESNPLGDVYGLICESRLVVKMVQGREERYLKFVFECSEVDFYGPSFLNIVLAEPTKVQGLRLCIPIHLVALVVLDQGQNRVLGF